MSNKKIWFITGAGRGLGIEIAKAALAAGHAVVATGRDPQKVSTALGDHEDLLCLQLDVTRIEDAQAATVERRAAQSADRVMFEILVMAPRYRVWPARAEAAPAWAVMLPLLVCTASTMMTFQEPLAWTVSWLPSAMAVWP